MQLLLYYQLISLILENLSMENNLGLRIKTGAEWMSLRHLAYTYVRYERVENRIAQVGYKRSNKITNVFHHREIYRGFIVL